MIKYVIIGVWGAIMMGAGVFIEQSLRKMPESQAAGVAKSSEIDQLVTEMNGAPIIINGKVEGYIVFRTRSVIDRGKLIDPKLDVAPFLLDATFTAAYSHFEKGVPNIRPDDIQQLTTLVAEYANKKLGAEVVRNVELEQFNYVPRDKVRENMFAKNP